MLKLYFLILCLTSLSLYGADYDFAKIALPEKLNPQQEFIKSNLEADLRNYENVYFTASEMQNPDKRTVIAWLVQRESNYKCVKQEVAEMCLFRVFRKLA